LIGAGAAQKGPQTLPSGFGKSASPCRSPVDSGASKTGLPVGLLAASNTGVFKSKAPYPQRLPVFTDTVFDNYLKKLSIV
jgi:hypothetical protein